MDNVICNNIKDCEFRNCVAKESHNNCFNTELWFCTKSKKDVKCVPIQEINKQQDHIRVEIEKRIKNLEDRFKVKIKFSFEKNQRR
ncbi:MAG: hypothetical protein V1663_01705 [archaeon]